MSSAHRAGRGWAVLGLAALVVIGWALLPSREEPAGDAREAVPAAPRQPAPETADRTPPAPEPAGEPDSSIGAETPRREASAECAPATDSEPSTARTIGMPAASDLAAVSARIVGSSDPEHLAAAALLAETPAERIDHIARAIETGRDNPVVVWIAVRLCSDVLSDESRDADCPMQEWERDLLRLDNQNSEAWILVAANRLRRGETDTALEAMQIAAAAPVTNEYFAESVAMVQRAVAAAGGYSFREQALIAFGVAAATPLPSYADYLRMCTEQAETDRLWAEACLEYGRLAERQSTTIIGRAVSQTIQEAALDAMGYDASEVVARREAERRAQIASVTLGTPELVLESPARLASFLTLLKEQGEWSANARMQEEAARMQEQDRQAGRGSTEATECR